MQKIVNIDTGAECYELMMKMRAALKKPIQDTGHSIVEYNVSRKAVEEYNKICAGLESYGRAIIKEHPINFQAPSSLTAARQEAYDITRGLKQGG